MTNWHVVERASEIRCLLHDGTALHADVAGSDKDTDLALLRLRRDPGAPPLPCAALGDSDVLREGDFVMAMGAPWGMARSVSIGIVACVDRNLPGDSEYSLWLQTDASISPGNSGGPLVNTAGEVVGINARAAMAGGDLGFSIPSSTVRFVVDQIRLHGRVPWMWTGLQLQPLRDFNRDMYFEGDEGVIVSGTDPDSPARSAGLEPRDRIFAIAGIPITARVEEELSTIRRRLAMLPAGSPATIDFVRGEERRSVEIVPREKGSVEGEELDCPRWDFTAKAINRFNNPDLHFHRAEGIFIFGVKQPGNASSAGLQSQDILVSIDGREIRTLGELTAIHGPAVQEVERKHRVLLTVLRNGLMRQIVLDFSRDYEKR